MQILLNGPAAAFFDDRHVGAVDITGTLRRIPEVAAYRRRVYAVRLQRISNEAIPKLEAVIRAAWPVNVPQ
jgi:hypothetical protein